MAEILLKINGINREGGEGVAVPENGGPILVPHALPGERVRVQLKGTIGGLPAGHIVEIVEPSEHRQKPVCRHYGICGGCSMQLLKKDAYLAWKRDWIRGVLGVGKPIDTIVNEAVPIGEGTRRRAVFGARRTKKTVQLGYRRRSSHDLVDIEECPVLMPAIADELASLRGLIRPVLSRKATARLTVLATENGLDIAIDDAKPMDDIALREQMVTLAEKRPIARLTINDEPLVEFAPPLVKFGSFAVIPPPKAFLQAVEESQQAMIAKVLELLPEKTGRVTDLFCGLGTFTLPVAQKHVVQAVEADISMLEGLKKATSVAKGLKTIEILQRDLFKMPLSVLELRDVDAIVLDPPRAGAKAQVSEFSRSDVATVIYISCDPVNFSRDAHILVEGGYELKSVTPFDQFLYSSHVELVAHFVKT